MANLLGTPHTGRLRAAAVEPGDEVWSPDGWVHVTAVGAVDGRTVIDAGDYRWTVDADRPLEVRTGPVAA